MNDFEFNKIFAAVLCAGIAAWMGWFISYKLVHPHMLHEDAVFIDGAAVADSGPAAPTGPDPIMALIATADVAKGEKLSKACAACHSFDQGGPNKVGPNLYGVVGGPMAHVASFEYSASLAGFGKNWGYDELNHFLYKPKAYIAGTKMNYAGLKKPEDRAAMIAWMKTQGSSGFPNPNASEIAAEEAALAPPEAAEAVEEAVEGVVEDLKPEAAAPVADH